MAKTDKQRTWAVICRHGTKNSFVLKNTIKGTKSESIFQAVCDEQGLVIAHAGLKYTEDPSDRTIWRRLQKQYGFKCVRLTLAFEE